MREQRLDGLSTAPLPHRVIPMYVHQTRDFNFGEEWICEPKLDGYRAIAILDRGNVLLHSRLLHPLERFPSIVQELAAISVQMVLDGEIVALNEEGVQDINELRKNEENRAGNTTYHVFDILYYGGFDLTSYALKRRKPILAELFAQADFNSDLVVPVNSVVGRKKARELMQDAQARGLEGVIFKNPESPYTEGTTEGKKRKEWFKILNYKKTGFGRSRVYLSQGSNRS